ncbi:MAG: tRNA (5-methylaminomethyl-2-thiouridine)(34)-methyltransferase MnmD [Bacteroidia bacterium]|nr:tRNA (5-methylaminomethyl-2-thiouridine)(34)-methyltransferase MnmD [Bacteroidia bacterium]
MKRKIISTADGSKTIQLEEWNEQYHSIHGAKQEAEHVFIEHGLLFCIDSISKYNKQELSIMEMGFGTGLNAYLTLIASHKQRQNINYVGIEAFPVASKELDQLNYTSLCHPQFETYFHSIHNTGWEEKYQINNRFWLTKKEIHFNAISAQDDYHLIYFDAFGPRVQPELWEESMFLKMYMALKTQGVLVTYSAKGSVRRAMESVGFKVERLPGPPGKREMLRAIK